LNETGSCEDWSFKRRRLPVGADSSPMQISIPFEDSYFKNLHYLVLTENLSLCKFYSPENILIISIRGKRILNILLEFINSFSLIL